MVLSDAFTLIGAIRILNGTVSGFSDHRITRSRRSPDLYPLPPPGSSHFIPGHPRLAWTSGIALSFGLESRVYPITGSRAITRSPDL